MVGGGGGHYHASTTTATVIESSKDDLDDDEDLPEVQHIQHIWDNERTGHVQEDEEDMDDFIDYEDEEEAGGMDEQEHEQRRCERKKKERQRRRAMANHPELSGVDANAWDEIHDVFGDGHEYDWALGGDNEMEPYKDTQKPEMKYQDVFEPSEILARMLTEDDDLICAQDIPECMQLVTSSLSQSATLSLHQNLSETDIDGVAAWVTSRLSA
ncbi:hypothetical protein SCLCIDRAFT_23460 [Scleroderma citrinum Foug A]|uniref:Uncharacterized protein n=1 Tax=Scleroderma citrinum Foug A TaxID=1036808 RepID=A0A0C2ZSC7_9AGAM|nr:hypothetical protein SCLCIDRAFT_23460 [Scleroderma citrinum Foug A]